MKIKTLYTTLIIITSYFYTFFLNSSSIDENVNEILSPISNKVASFVFYSVSMGEYSFPLILGWLIIASLFCTFYFGFINIRGFGIALKFLTSKREEKKAPGEVSHRQALWTATAATVGLGNIAGVAIAVSLGGPGATFWMILAGFLGMSLKFCECTLGVKYRIINSDGSVSGGPMYYLSRGLKEIGLARLGKFLAIMFSICCIGGALGGGNMFQANQSYQQFLGITGGDESFFYDNAWLYGLILAILLGTVIIGGIKSIAKVTEKLVPLMAAIYILCALIIIFINFEFIGEAFNLIFIGAFTGEGIAGGLIGVLIQGFKRAAFSNEAGLGSAPIAHSAVRTNYPITEGYVALLEPFIDTVVICTMTALVIIITGMHLNTEGYGGIELTSKAFAKDIAWFPYVLAISAILFAFSTMISWSYYGLKSWTYLFGKSKNKENVFKIIFCFFVIIGSSLNLGSVIDLSDSMIFLMALFNIIGVYLLISKVKEELIDYKRIKSSE
ncbi:MAG: Amino-acid carrier protein AlsT [Alphaproteobacteria bacterium MarineAlpha9_Bin4]|nr:alanine glycine permease [Pelagibacterales bacterium]PPR25956.1 MAG: Amino-acid carrier protein AlsT [Alphaproteobacteria bacterium MarineAlpha9_Bin4]|tara:strand:- start:409 stop:1908 length:1500 start_codon:yes stop_codon:yes gene_type:complete